MVHSCTFVLEIELTVKYEIEYKTFLVAGPDEHVDEWRLDVSMSADSTESLNDLCTASTYSLHIIGLKPTAFAGRGCTHYVRIGRTKITEFNLLPSY